MVAIPIYILLICMLHKGLMRVVGLVGGFIIWDEFQICRCLMAVGNVREGTVWEGWFLSLWFR